MFGTTSRFRGNQQPVARRKRCYSGAEGGLDLKYSNELLGALATGELDEARALAASVDVYTAAPIVAFAADLALCSPDAPDELRVELETPELRAFALAIAPALTEPLLRA